MENLLQGPQVPGPWWVPDLMCPGVGAVLALLTLVSPLLFVQGVKGETGIYQFQLVPR